MCSYAADIEALVREGFLHRRATQAIFCKIDIGSLTLVSKRDGTR